ncbi:hypothetical protein CPC08DRAFT_649217 [Agrocybe pediades]|nr:hypothetical protein CPC08DRAFT_649217 [Agrocybe pediades]
MKIELKLQQEFPPIFNGEKNIYEPTIVMDCNGCILLWYLPGIFPEETQADLFQSLQSLEKSMVIKPGSTSWRASEVHFQRKEEWLKPGNITLSPAWFQQAHESSLQRTNKLEISQGLRNSRTVKWVEANSDKFALAGAVLSIMQPGLYDVSCQTLDLISKAPQMIHHQEQLQEILRIWSSPYTVINIISNRQTPVHRDNGTFYAALDTLLSVGSYKEGVFHLPSLGIKLAYPPGTMIGMASRVLPHAASFEGNRACLAFYTRQNVMEKLGVLCPDWANVDNIIRQAKEIHS